MWRLRCPDGVWVTKQAAGHRHNPWPDHQLASQLPRPESHKSSGASRPTFRKSLDPPSNRTASDGKISTHHHAGIIIAPVLQRDVHEATPRRSSATDSP